MFLDNDEFENPLPALAQGLEANINRPLRYELDAEFKPEYYTPFNLSETLSGTETQGKDNWWWSLLVGALIAVILFWIFRGR